MSVDYSDLVHGQIISEGCHVLDADAVERYRDAVGDWSKITSVDGEEVAPPMAVAALSLRGVIKDLAIPGGALHAGQELEFKGAVHVGETLRCSAKILQNSVRGKWRFLVVQLYVETQVDQRVMEGKSTIMVPA